MKLIEAATSQHITHGSSSRQDSPPTSTPILLREVQCVVGCGFLEIDDVRAVGYADLEDKG